LVNRWPSPLLGDSGVSLKDHPANPIRRGLPGRFSVNDRTKTFEFVPAGEDQKRAVPIQWALIQGKIGVPKATSTHKVRHHDLRLPVLVGDFDLEPDGHRGPEVHFQTLALGARAGQGMAGHRRCLHLRVTIHRGTGGVLDDIAGRGGRGLAGGGEHEEED